MNLNLFGLGPPGDEEWIAVDCGIGFNDSSLLGTTVEMADPSFIADRRHKLLAIVVTHAHEDHLGAIPYLWPALQCPVFATPFAATILQRKLEETTFGDAVPIRIVDDKEVCIGPFRVSYIGITHSIPESNSILIQTDLGTALHTGDWKLDDRPIVGSVTEEGRFQDLGALSVDALICDSTNVFRDGWSGSESLVRATLDEVLGRLTGRVAVTTFASNVARMDSAIRSAALHGRRTLVLGRAMHNMIAAARQNGLLPQLPEFCSEEEAAYLPPDKLLILCTGSQGQPGAALDRISRGQNRSIGLGPGDTVLFSSRTIPGNETAVGALQNRLSEMGVSLITDSDEQIHVSGHPYRGELARMYEWVQPRIAIPVHGEPRHLREHARIARQIGIEEVVAPENGMQVRIAPLPVAFSKICQGRKLNLDGNMLVQSNASHLSSREKMSKSGFIGLTLIFSKAGQVNTAMFFEGIPPSVEAALETAISEALRGPSHIAKRKDRARLEQTLHQLIVAIAERDWGKAPFVRVLSLGI